CSFSFLISPLSWFYYQLVCVPLTVTKVYQTDRDKKRTKKEAFEKFFTELRFVCQESFINGGVKTVFWA
ncbi:MAG: hypothetical protein II146_06860, partial [Treponema sp.]|nr:hypothetical protein [Treponema sp.]